jgi:putative transposase
VLDALTDKLPKVAEHLDAARAELLAFTAFPKQIWRQIWSNNPLSVNRPSQDTSPRSGVRSEPAHEGGWMLLRAGR